jgi:hypothetical protein
VKKITIFVLTGGMVLGGCSGSRQSQTSGQQQTKTSSADGKDHPSGAPQQVQVSQVQSAKLNTMLSLPAQIVPYQIVDVYPKVTGFIDALRVGRVSVKAKASFISPRQSLSRNDRRQPQPLRARNRVWPRPKPN